MRLAIVGARGSGKSTLFRAFVGAERAPQPGAGGVTTAVVKVRDERLEYLRDLDKPAKFTPVHVEVCDFPGLPDPHETTGMKLSELLAAAREADAIIVCVRAFEAPTYPYADPRPRPAEEAAHVVAELAFADLDVAVRRLEKLERKGGNMTELERREQAALGHVRGCLEDGKPVKLAPIGETDRKLLRGYRFLTEKPWILVAALPDEGGEGTELAIEGPFEERIAVRTKLESEVAELDPADRPAFMAELGLDALASERVLRASFHATGTIAFFTRGEDEVRAWPVNRGATAIEAAGKIHTDLARGFIRAEVYSWDDLRAAGGDVHAVKKAGKFRVEGRDHVIHDGDVVTIRFSV